MEATVGDFRYHATRKGLFVHVHKCAGSAIRETIRWTRNVWWSADKRIVLTHRRRPFFPNEFVTDPMPEGLWEEAYKFAFVRNPWERLVSALSMFNQVAKYRRAGERDWVIEDLLDVVADDSLVIEPLVLRDLDTQLIWNDSLVLKIHTLPASHPYYHLDEMDFIGRFERLTADWTHICDVLGVGRVLPAPRLNSTRHRHYSTYFTPQLRDRVAALYAEDIERFGYQFEEDGK